MEAISSAGYTTVRLRACVCIAGFFFVRTRKKLKGAKTQENGNSRKKLKLKEKIPFSGIF